MSEPIVGEADVKDSQIIHAALLNTLRYVQKDTPSNYALARHIVTTSMLLAQECKGGYLKGIAQLFRDDTGEDYKEWTQFRNKLLAQALKAQTIVQAVATLLEDWQIDQPEVKQLGLFADATSRPVPDMTTGAAG
jgi:hypothetical protein